MMALRHVVCLVFFGYTFPATLFKKIVGLHPDRLMKLVELFQEGFGKGCQLRTASQWTADVSNQQGLTEAFFRCLDFTPYGAITHFQFFGGRFDRPSLLNRFQNTGTAQPKNDPVVIILDPHLGADMKLV